jgi:expansin (peptidoglycan-binding protein)
VVFRRASLIALCCLSVLAGSTCGAPGSPDAGLTGDGGTVTTPDAGTGTSTTDGGTTSAVRPLSPQQDGIATYYDATGAGACSYDASPGDLRVAAMNTPQWDNSAVCGMCVRVEGPRGQVTVRIVDRCPECLTGHLDLSREAFAAIADPADGRVSVKWQPVSCDVQGPVIYRFKEGSSQWWTGIQVRNTRVPVRSLEVQQGGAWVNVARQDYNFFVESSGLGVGPYTLRVTGSDGQQLIESGVMLRSDGDAPGTVQFQ